MERLNIYAFADEASGQISGQIAAMRRNGLNGLEIRGVDGQSIADITVEKAREVRRIEQKTEIRRKLILRISSFE